MNANQRFADFGKRLKSMLRVDARRTFTMPTVYVIFAVSFALPILILVMTSFMGGTPDSGGTAMAFTNVWQAIGSAGSAMSMDLTSMCNINLLYFLILIFVCLFVGEDFKSGFAKNLFTVRPKKLDYVISKTVLSFAASAGTFALYFIGAMIGGKIAGLSFDVTAVGASAGGVAACFISKIFLALVFVAVALVLSTVAKRRIWLSILLSIGGIALTFAVISIAAPINSTALNVLLCAVGGVIFAAALGAVSNAVLNKTDLV